MGRSLSLGPESGRTGLGPPRRHAPGTAELIPLSFIRTVTVGVGIAPTLLTPPDCSDGRSRAQAIARHHRRWGLAPRPENVAAGVDCFGGLASIDRLGMLGKADLGPNGECSWICNSRDALRW